MFYSIKLLAGIFQLIFSNRESLRQAQEELLTQVQDGERNRVRRIWNNFPIDILGSLIALILLMNQLYGIVIIIILAIVIEMIEYFVNERAKI